MSTKELRDLERQYRRERAELIEDPGLSWEEMYRIKRLFGRCARERDALRRAAEDAEDWTA